MTAKKHLHQLESLLNTWTPLAEPEYIPHLDRHAIGTRPAGDRLKQVLIAGSTPKPLSPVEGIEWKTAEYFGLDDVPAADPIHEKIANAGVAEFVIMVPGGAGLRYFIGIEDEDDGETPRQPPSSEAPWEAAVFSTHAQAAAELDKAMVTWPDAQFLVRSRAALYALEVDGHAYAVGPAWLAAEAMLKAGDGQVISFGDRQAGYSQVLALPADFEPQQPIARPAG